MKFNDIEELKEALWERDAENTTFFVDPDYISAVIGISTDDRVVYSYEKMVEFLMNSDGIAYEDAEEFIEYNTIRTIPYMGKNSPIIVKEEI